LAGSIFVCIFASEIKNKKNMQIVTTREFRAHQKKYFNLAEREKVYVTRRNARPIIISVANEDTPNEVTLAAMKEAQSGKPLEELDVDKFRDFVDAL
jgi:hypothetical protein